MTYKHATSCKVTFTKGALQKSRYDRTHSHKLRAEGTEDFVGILLFRGKIHLYSGSEEALTVRGII